MSMTDMPAATGVASGPELADNLCFSSEIDFNNPSLVLRLVDPWLVTRRSLTHLLETMSGGILVEAVASLGDLSLTKPDLILLNLHSARLNDFEVSSQLDLLRKTDFDVPCVVITDVADACLAEEALHVHGVKGYLTTSVKPAVLLAVLRLVFAGGTYIPADLLARPATATQPDENVAATAVPQGFTARELDVFRLLREAKPNKIIAHQLQISENTAKVHVRNIMRKLKATNRTQVAIRI